MAVANTDILVVQKDGSGLICKTTVGDVIAGAAGSVSSVNGKTGDVTLDAADVGALASGDDISELVNDAGYITSADLPTVGDGQLTIKTSDGTELGSFTANQATGADVEITLPAAAAVYWTEGTDQLYPTTASNSVLIGGTLPGSANITLDASGDASFAGTVTAATFDLESLSELP